MSATLVLYCSTVTEWVIEDLEPFQVYSVGVATQTRGPLGNFSVEQEARTFGDGESLQHTRNRECMEMGGQLKCRIHYAERVMKVATI